MHVQPTEMPLSPSMAFSRVLEAVSCGVLAPDGPGLKDPCEREDIDVVSDLDNQQREDLMASAQDFIRKVSSVFYLIDTGPPSISFFHSHPSLFCNHNFMSLCDSSFQESFANVNNFLFGFGKTKWFHYGSPSLYKNDIGAGCLSDC